MNGATSLLDFILNLLKNPQAQAEFRGSPEQVLAANGLTGVCAADIHETLPLVTDHCSVELTSTGHSAPPSVVPAGDESGTHAAIQYLHYITCTYRYDDHGAHVHDPGHENIWAVGDVTHDFDGGQVVPDGPAPVASGHFPAAVAPSPGGAVDTGSWGRGDNHGNTFGHGGNLTDGDHANGMIYGDHVQGDGLHSFGSGAPTTPASGTGSPVAYSDGTRGWDGSTSTGHPEDSGNAAGQAGPDDSGHSYDAHGVPGGSYYEPDSEHGTWDGHEPHIYLDLH